MARVSKRKDAKRQEAMFADERADQELRDRLEALCRLVAGLDGAGLPLEHKRAIADAKRLSHDLRRS